MSKLKEACQGKWRSLLPSFGVPARVMDGKHQSCPLCPGDGGKDRFRFDDNKGLGTYFCSQCGAGDGVSFLMKFKGWEFKRTAEELEKIVGTVEREFVESKRNTRKIRDMMEHIWKSGSRLDRFDPVGKYLASRGIIPDMYPNSLKYVQECYYSKGVHHPAMVAIFQAPDGRAGQLHRTYLGFDGKKANVDTIRKQMPMSFPEGGAVRLGGIAPKMGIAEGIETALAASILFGMPVWAALNKTLLMKFQPIAGTESLTIFADNDTNYAGQSSAFSLASKVCHQHPEMEVRVKVPELPGTDWNDELIANISAQGRQLRAAG